MNAMARRLLTGASVVAILGLSGPAFARPAGEQPRTTGISACVMTVLEMFQGGMRGAMISLFARGGMETGKDPIGKKKPSGGGLEEVVRTIP